MATTSMRMPPFMRHSNALLLTLSAWQYGSADALDRSGGETRAGHGRRRCRRARPAVIGSRRTPPGAFVAVKASGRYRFS
jgi:hypothetical protein